MLQCIWFVKIWNRCLYYTSLSSHTLQRINVILQNLQPCLFIVCLHHTKRFKIKKKTKQNKTKQPTSGVARTFGAHGQQTIRGPPPYVILGLKKCLFALFWPTQNFGKLFFFFDTQFCIFRHNCENKNFKIHCNSPKNLLCRHRGYMCLPIHVSTRFFDVIYLNAGNYMLYIAFLQHPD